jgi:hypothetical protein
LERARLQPALHQVEILFIAPNNTSGNVDAPNALAHIGWQVFPLSTPEDFLDCRAGPLPSAISYNRMARRGKKPNDFYACACAQG